MKINPVSIQSYQQISQRDRAAQQSQKVARGDSAVEIQPQTNSATSALAVKVGGTYAQHLSPEETQALDMLFSKFREADRFGAGYKPSADNSASVGRVIDVKV